MRYSRRNPLARYSFGWPFGVIEVRENALLLDVPKPYQWLYRASRNTFGRVLDLTLYPPIPLMVPLDAIESITVTAGRIGMGRITSFNPMFSLITFGALGGRFSQVLAALDDQNVLLRGVETTL